MTDVLITRFIDNINSLNAENVNEVLDDTYTQQINFYRSGKNNSRFR